MTRIPLDDPRFYFNRHLQWLAFNQGVLEEARERNPLRLLGPDGVCARPLRGRGRKPFIAQEQLMNRAGGGVNRSANGHKTDGQLAYTENAEAISSSATASPEHDSQDSSNATV